ncbi:MAG: NAD(P)H-hydrate dehydratase [Gammaproteobacteria bacterium]
MNQPLRTLPDIEGLPHALYTAEQVRRMDRLAMQEFGLPSEILMERAGSFAFDRIREQWPAASDLTVLCGTGNNGGDGYVVARLARAAGMNVRILQLGNPNAMQGAAAANAGRCAAEGLHAEMFHGLPASTDLIVDAMLGTGLDRSVGGLWAEAIESVNRHRAPVLSLDIPSGLNSDSGAIMGHAIEADVTTTFIALKRGMFTGDGPDCCGRVEFSSLDVPARLYAAEILSARRLDWRRQQTYLQPRKATMHKGEAGHVLVIGGSPGFSGAARLAGEAALRSGAGLVSIATHPDHASFMNVGLPEIMCHAIATPDQLDALVERCDVIAIGPGLGRGAWGREIFNALAESDRPVVMDADALGLLCGNHAGFRQRIMTPHPGEAARLLGVDAGQIQQERFAAAAKLQSLYGGTVVLKGAGTLVTSGDNRPPAVCSEGNPGMATAGMGDVLTGVIAALLAQGLDSAVAAETGVALHAAAADEAAKQGMRGMIASDLFAPIRRLLG